MLYDAWWRNIYRYGVSKQWQYSDVLWWNKSIDSGAIGIQLLVGGMELCKIVCWLVRQDDDIKCWNAKKSVDRGPWTTVSFGHWDQGNISTLQKSEI